MNILRIIKEEINALNEYDNEDSFLKNYETAKRYAYENIDDVAEAFDEYNENPEDINNSYRKDKYVELIDLYVDKYNELKNNNNVTIYRLIKLNSLNDLDANNIGKHWSFEKSGVGAYGEQHPNRGMMKTGKSYILEGLVDSKNIDWIYGFNSFVWYGEDQWECALNKGAIVKILKINDNVLKKPINSIVGDY